MRGREPKFGRLTAAGGLVALLLLGWLWWAWGGRHEPGLGTTATPATVAPALMANPERGPADSWAPPVTGAVTEAERDAVAAMLRERLNHRFVRAGEAILTFRDEPAYRAFLVRAMHTGAELRGKIDGLLAVRVRVGDYAAFVRELAENTAGYVSISANAIVSAPPPPPETRAAGVAMAVDGGLLNLIEAGPGAGEYGRGVLIAVLDGGVAADAAFGARLRYLDIGYGVVGLATDTRHGTAVASIAAGAAPDAPGVAPAAELLSIRVLGPDGTSDAFAVAQGIVAAVDAGARVINVSLGGYATSAVLGAAVDYALVAGAAVVAASGNDQVERLVWPAAYPGVVSVGAVDATGRQARFSNSGEGLQLTAPGVGVRAVAPGGERFLFSGTSAGAPVVAGAIAALLAREPGLDGLQAADLLAAHANDAGAPGDDPEYGRGTLNLGWALGRADADRVDPALSTQVYDALTGELSLVVQNRGGRALDGLELIVEAGDAVYRPALPALAAGASVVVKVPLDRARIAAAERTEVRSRLVLPAGLADQNPANNALGGVVRGGP